MPETGSAPYSTPAAIALLWEAGNCYERAGKLSALRKYAESEAAFKQALEKRKQALGGDDALVAQMQNELGGVFLEQGKIQQAQDCFAQAQSILETVYYAGHAKLAPVLDHQADCLLQLNRLEEAEAVLKRALDIKDKTLTAEHRDTLAGALRLAKVCRKLGKHADGEAVLNKYMKNVDTPLGPSEAFRFELGLLYLEQGKKNEAELAFKQAIEGFARRANWGALIAALEAYGEFLRQEGKIEESQACLARAQAARQEAPAWYQLQDLFSATLLRA